MRNIGVVTGSRADYGIYLPLLRALDEDKSLELDLYVTGSHLAPALGRTITMIEADGFRVSERIESLLSGDSPGAIAKSMGVGLQGFAQAFDGRRPDILVVLGDRFEMHAAATAALPFKIPVAHIQGGEITEGAFDDALRHSMTKLSHIHFVTTQESADRLIQMGEEPWRVTICGSLSLDNLRGLKLMDREELEAKLQVCLAPAPLLVTFHPTTLEYERAEWQVVQLCEALRQFKHPVVFTFPNADTHGGVVVAHLEKFVQASSTALMVDTFGTRAYFSMMSMAAAMVGNSSSGIIEAASFKLPVVNIGTRQRGRQRANNVIDVDYNSESIVKGLERALSPQFKDSLQDLVNPYDLGGAVGPISDRLKSEELSEHLLRKRFNVLH